MDIAVALIVGLFGGVVGSVVTTLLRISHERAERLRERMIVAADDFVTGGLQAQVELWEAMAAPERGSTVAERLPEALRRIAEAHARLARVKLLFGIDTDAGKAAEALINTLWNGRHALEHDPPDIETAAKANGDALTQLNEFTAAAREQLNAAQPGKPPPASKAQ